MSNYRGAAFVRTFLSMMGAHDMRGALDTAQKSWGSSSQPVTILKAAVAAGTLGNSLWAGNVAEAQGAQVEFLEVVRPQTIVGRLANLRRVPVRVPVAANTTGAVAYFVGEGAAKPVTSAAFDRKRLEPTKVVSLTVVSDELLRFGPAGEMSLRDDLAAAIAMATDAAFINRANTGVPGDRPAAVTVGATTIPSSGTNAAAIRTDIEAAIAAFQGALTTAAWVTHPRTAVSIGLRLSAAGIANDLGALGGTLAGLPVITSEAVTHSTATGGDLILLDAASILLAEEGITPSRADQAAIAMSDTPGTGNAVPVSLWQTNSVALMVERVINWDVGRENAVVVVTGARYVGA